MATHDDPTEVAEYADEKGNTWQLTADQAKALGYTAVSNKAVAPTDTTNKSASTRRK